MPKTGMIGHDVVEQIRARADLAQLIGETVTLKRVGSRLVGLCPFHKDTKPSFYVNPERGFFKCFGCGIGGDLFRYVMEMQRLAFPDAVRYLADRYNIEIPETHGPGKPRGYRDRLFAANEAALSFFREMLAHAEIGRPAREYLEQRATPRAMIDQFELGYAPDSWDRLVNALIKRGVAMVDAAAVRLVAQREKSDTYFDFFRNRLMFPIRNESGKVVAFSGRLLSGDGPKYINSPESDVYTKGRIFFPIHLAAMAIKKRDQALICEGNFDVLSLHQHGFPQGVAALGTAFTENHAELLELKTRNVVFLFDGDAAGQKAMARVLEIYLHREYMPRAVVLPAGEDPDSFLKAKGTEALETLASQAPTLIDFAVDRIFAEHGSGQENQARALAEACTLAARLISPIRRDLLAKMLAGRTRTSEDSVRQQIARAQRGSRAAPATPPSRTGRILPPSESTILAALLHYPQVRGQVPEESILTALPDGPIRTVAKRLLDAPAGPQAITADQLTHEDDDEQVHNLVARLMFAEPSFEAKQAARALQDAINDLESRKLEAEIKSVRAELDRARQEGPRERYDELFKRLIALQKQLEMIRI